MADSRSYQKHSLSDRLIATWKQQVRDGFILADPSQIQIPTRCTPDPLSGVSFRFRWMPHRELRGNVDELQKLGILNPDADPSKLFRDPRDPQNRHCFLCEENIRECHPLERLLPLKLAGGNYWAGANFAWIELNHYTIMSAEHRDQQYTPHTLEAMFDLHNQTDGQFRVLYNGNGAGASIPWHLHYQITTEPMPVEELTPDRVDSYPTAILKFDAATSDRNLINDTIRSWIERDPQHHTLNLLVAGRIDDCAVYFFPRDQRRARTAEKGLMGGFEAAGDFVLSGPNEESAFENASSEMARTILSQINPI